LFRAGLNKFGERTADNLLERRLDEIAEHAVDGANPPVDANRHQDVIEGVDQIAVALLRTGDDVKELVQLFVAGGLGVALLEAAQETAQFGNLAGLLPQVSREKHDQQNQTDGQRLKPEGQRANGTPRSPGVSENQQKQNQEGEPPKLILALLEACKVRSQ